MRQLRFLLALALAITVVVGCSAGTKNNNAGAIHAANHGVAKATPTPTPEALVQTAISNTDALKAFHFTLTYENGSTPIAQGISMTKADGDFVKPDRFKATVSGKAAGGFS